MAVNKGFEPKIYEAFYDDTSANIGVNDFLVGRLMFDEMKLQSGIIFNCKNGVMSGFVTNNDGVYSLSTVTKDIIKDIKEYKISELKSMNSANCLPTNPKSTDIGKKTSKKTIMRRAMNMILQLMLICSEFN